MSRTIPDDIWARAQAIVATGDYKSEFDVLRNALTMLEHFIENRRCDMESILDGIDDMEAGRCVSFEEFDADFRKRNNMPKAE